MSNARRQSRAQTASQPQEHRPPYASFVPDLPYRPVPMIVTKSSSTQLSTTPTRKPRSRTTQTKRKRSSPEDIDADYDDLEIDMDDSGGR